MRSMRDMIQWWRALGQPVSVQQSRSSEVDDPESLTALERQIRATLELQGGQESADGRPGSHAAIAARAAIPLIAVPAGSFVMGSPDEEWGRDGDEGPQREVTVNAFLLGRYPVTNSDYERYLHAHPEARRPESLDDPRFSGPRQPVVRVTCLEAEQFAAWVGGRLPTEAEWEYACRAGTITSTYAGDVVSEDDPRLNAIAWHRANSDYKTHAVGEKVPNAWGLHDMLGNVWEWCADWYSPYRNRSRAVLIG